LEWPSPTVEWEAGTAATRYLCAAAHLRRSMLPRRVRDSTLERERAPHAVGREYARRVIRGPGVIAPCPGVDTAWVIRHCHASWTQTAIRDVAAVGVLAGFVYYFPLGTSVWLGLIAAAVVLSACWRRIRKRRTRFIAAALVLAAYLAVVGVLLHGGRDLRLLGLPLIGLAGCLFAFVLDSFVVWVRLRRISAALKREPRSPFPFGPLTRDLGAAARLHRSNVVFYERGRIVGAGTPERKRTLTTPIDEARQGRRAEQFKAAELLDYIKDHIRRQGEAGHNTHGLPELQVQEVLAKPVSQMKKADPTATALEISRAANQGPSGSTERAYLAARATTWDGELTGSIYVSVALEGRYLRLVVLPYVMAPVVDELRTADAVAGRGLFVQVPWSVLGGVRELWQVLIIARDRMRTYLEQQSKRVRRAAADGLPPAPTTLSLREKYAKEFSEDLHQDEDGLRIIQVLEQRVFTVVETFLDEHGIATRQFREQANHVINSYVMVTGDNNNIATGAGAHAGNSATSPAPAQQGAG
jgi:hypothetical protein